MANKNITMQQKNTAGSYDKLYPKTTATQSKLSAETAALYGDGVTDADAAMRIVANTIKDLGFATVIVKDPNGNPIQGAIITGIQGSPTTDANGKASGVLQSATISVRSPYVDLQSTDITISVKVNDVTYTKTFTVNVVEVLPSSYEVHSISGVQYGFELNADGLYESQNKGKESTFALCKVTIYNPAGLNVFVDCINYAEQGFDYGILGNVDTVLESNKTADNTSKVKQTFKNSSSADIQTVEYGALETDSYIYIKYIKDGSSDKFNDSLQFKVRFE